MRPCLKKEKKKEKKRKKKRKEKKRKEKKRKEKKRKEKKREKNSVLAANGEGKKILAKTTNCYALI